MRLMPSPKEGEGFFYLFIYFLMISCAFILASRSASNTASGEVAGRTVQAVRVSLTTSEMPLKESFFSMKAETASSSAAIRAAGAVPPIYHASVAAVRRGNASVSGLWKVRLPTFTKSRGSPPKGARSGYARAYLTRSLHRQYIQPLSG